MNHALISIDEPVDLQSSALPPLQGLGRIVIPVVVGTNFMQIGFCLPLSAHIPIICPECEDEINISLSTSYIPWLVI